MNIYSKQTSTKLKSKWMHMHSTVHCIEMSSVEIVIFCTSILHQWMTISSLRHQPRPAPWDTSSRQHSLVSASQSWDVSLSISVYPTGYDSGNDLYLPLLQYIWYFECKNIRLSELMQLLCKYNFGAAKKWVVSCIDGSRGPRVRVSQFSSTWSPTTNMF